MPTKISNPDYKKGYNEIKLDGSDRLYQDAERIIDGLSKLGKFTITAKAEGEYSKVANRLLIEGKEQGKLKYAVFGAKIYELLGKAEKPFVLKNLLSAANSQKIGGDRELLDWIDYFRAKHYSDKFPKELVPEGNPEPVFGDPKYLAHKQKKEKEYNLFKRSLESKVLKSVFGAFALAGIFFSISSMTGAVVGFSNSFSIPFGIGLFVIGIAGLFFGNKY